MKKFLRTTFAFIFLASSVAVLSSCGDSDPVPTDVISDESGIKLDLEWSIAGGTTNDALTASDLDLRVYKNGVIVTDSDYASSFERIELAPGDFADGTYVVKVYLYNTTTDVNYVVTANGLTVSKPVTFTSNFDSEADKLEVETLTITKSGSKYTITQ
ncbi:MAG: hypothetical protein ABI663_07490 [Chryseolinea sp.]